MGSSRTRKMLLLGTAVCVVGAAVTVWASPPQVVGGADTFRPNRTRFTWTTNNTQTSSTNFTKVKELGKTAIKHKGPVVVTYTLKLNGAGPAEFRFAEDAFKPKKMTFDASSTTNTYSFTAVLQKSDWSCSDPALEWRSSSGSQVTLTFVSAVADFTRRGEEPDFACA